MSSVTFNTTLVDVFYVKYFTNENYSNNAISGQPSKIYTSSLAPDGNTQTTSIPYDDCLVTIFGIKQNVGIYYWVPMAINTGNDGNPSNTNKSLQLKSGQIVNLDTDVPYNESIFCTSNKNCKNGGACFYDPISNQSLSNDKYPGIDQYLPNPIKICAGKTYDFNVIIYIIILIIIFIIVTIFFIKYIKKNKNFINNIN